MKRLVMPLITLLLLSSFSVIAQNLSYTEVIKNLNTLLSNKQYQSAFDLSDQYTYEYGGLPEFDLLSGFSAYGAKRYQEAVFAFERVAIEAPDSYLARYYLAQTYVKLNNLQGAESELTRLLTTPLSSKQKQDTQNLLSQINNIILNKQQNFTHNVSGSMAFDNNINSGTAEDQIYINALDINLPLSEASKQTRDLTYAVGYQGSYQYPLSQRQSLAVNFGLNYVDYLEFNQYQRHALNLDLAFIQETPIGKVSVSGVIRPLWLDGEHYRSETGLRANWQTELSSNSGIMSGVSYSIIANEINPSLDLSRSKVSLSYLFKSTLVHTFMTHWQKDTSDNADYAFNDKDTLGGMYQLTWPISNAITSNTMILLEQHQFKGIHPYFLQGRDEKMTMLSSQLMFNANEKLRLKLYLNVQNKSSDIKLYSYDRVELGASWQYEL